MTLDTIRARLAQLETERQTLLEQAQLQLARLDGAIAALRQLLDEDAQPAQGDAQPA
jgi:hypothetical protein